MEGWALPVSPYRTSLPAPSTPRYTRLLGQAWYRAPFSRPHKSNPSRDLGGHLALPYFTNEEAEVDRVSEFMTLDS